jgi:hypothetical protein
MRCFCTGTNLDFRILLFNNYSSQLWTHWYSITIRSNAVATWILISIFPGDHWLVFEPLLRRFFQTWLHFGFNSTNAVVVTGMLIDLNVIISYSLSPPKTQIIKTRPTSSKSFRPLVTSAVTRTILSSSHCPSANLINLLLTLVHKLLSLFRMFYEWRGYVKTATMFTLCKRQPEYLSLNCEPRKIHTAYIRYLCSVLSILFLQKNNLFFPELSFVSVIFATASWRH